MRIACFALAAFLAAANGARAADSLGVSNEKLVVLTGKVVDVACELTKDCPPNCADGARQLGLKGDDGKLYIAAKSATIFAGLTRDLIGYCGKPIIADGLLTSNYGTTILMIQRLKPTESSPWIETSAFSIEWAKRHNTTPDGKLADEWYRNDPAVLDAVAKHGKTGLGQ